MADVRIGLIGMGEWARTVHIPNLLRTEGARITALASRSSERLQTAAEQVQASQDGTPPHLFDDYAELLADQSVDAVIVCTNNETHEAVTLQALEAGKHVLAEKPLSFSLEGCARVRDAAARAERVFQVGLELRYADVCQTLHAILEEGLIGRPRMAGCVIWRDWGAPQGWRASEASSGGIYLELGVHYLDVLDWLVGSGDVLVYSTGSQALGTEITDHFWTTLTYAAGARVNIGICVFAPAENLIPITIIGEKGRVAADVITGQVEVWLRDGTRLDRSPARPLDYHFDGFPGSQESLEAFVRSVHGGTPPLAGIDAATRATALALAAHESERTGRPAGAAAARVAG